LADTQQAYRGVVELGANKVDESDLEDKDENI
jgi:hypothetical protein